MKIKPRYLDLTLEAILFVLASFSMFSFVASLFNFVGSTVSPLPRMMPYYLSVLTLFYLLFVVHLLLFPKTEAKFRLTLQVNGLLLALLGLTSALLILIKVVGAEYSSFIMGGPSPLFPLDYFLLDLAILALGIVFAFRGFRYRTNPARLYFPSESGWVRRIFASLFWGLFVLIALYLSGAFLLEIAIANYGSATGWCMLPLWLLMGMPAAYLFYHDFFYKNGEEKTLSQKKLIALLVLGIALLLEICFLLALLLERNFIVEDATALFLLDFMKSWDAAPYLVSLMAVLPPFIAYLSFVFESNKKSKSLQKTSEK